MRRCQRLPGLATHAGLAYNTAIPYSPGCPARILMFPVCYDNTQVAPHWSVRDTEASRDTPATALISITWKEARVSRCAPVGASSTHVCHARRKRLCRIRLIHDGRPLLARFPRHLGRANSPARAAPLARSPVDRSHAERIVGRCRAGRPAGRCRAGRPAGRCRAERIVGRSHAGRPAGRSRSRCPARCRSPIASSFPG